MADRKPSEPSPADFRETPAQAPAPAEGGPAKADEAEVEAHPS